MKTNETPQNTCLCNKINAGIQVKNGMFENGDVYFTGYTVDQKTKTYSICELPLGKKQIVRFFVPCQLTGMVTLYNDESKRIIACPIHPGWNYFHISNTLVLNIGFDHMVVSGDEYHMIKYELTLS